MEDHHAKLEKLVLEAEDCELISRVAVVVKKRVAKLAVQLRAMARDVERTIVERAKADRPGMGAC